MSTWWQILSRRKHIPSTNANDLTSSTNSNNEGTTRLARVLTTFDLTALGVGSTLGVGVYVLAGHVAKDTAGPSVILSFLIAAFASVFAGLCYAEFGARVPRAGSAYIYSYATVGEFIAFIIGWNLILEYVIGSASVAKGLSVYVDTLINNTMQNAFIEIAPIHSAFMSHYFDFFSFTITMVLGAALAFGLKESSLVNNIFTILNIVVVLFVIIAGSIKADPNNWKIKKESIPPQYNGGEGGFFPFGIAGTIKGAATCFYGFVGFDCIATTGEEVKNPRRAIPISIILSLFIIFLSYFGTSAVVTLMLPYYEQDPDAPIPHAFEVIGWNWAKWIVSIGGIFGLCASLFGAMFPLPRIIYAMANDALVFRFLGSISSRFRTPVIGTILASILTGIMSALFNLKQLVNMMSIGTLLAYTIVAACVIILRYSVNEEESNEYRYSLLQPRMESDDEYSEEGHIYGRNETEYTENLNLIPPTQDITIGKIAKQLFNFSKRDPTYLSQKLVTVLVFIFSILCLVLASLVSFLQTNLENGDLNAVVPTGVVAGLMVIILISIYAQPTSNANLAFKVPLVPLIPALSICINLYLMMMLDGNTWIRFGVWMAVGLPIYYISSCMLNKKRDSKQFKTNGHINHSKINGTKTNGHALTIPEIIVDPPKSDVEETVDVVQSETKEIVNRKRTLSVDSKDLQEAVLEIDKVLNDSNIDDTFDDFEAINPENEYKNSSILIQNIDNNLQSDEPKENLRQYDNISIDSDSDSDHSREYHVKAQIHQEDFGEQTNFPSKEQILEENLVSNLNEVAEMLKNNNEETMENKNETISTIPEPPPMPEIKTDINKNMNHIPNKNTTKNEIMIPLPPPMPEGELTFIKDKNQNDNFENTGDEISMLDSEQTNIKETSQNDNSDKSPNDIPIPPPMASLRTPSPKTPTKQFIINFDEVKLKKVERTRTESTKSEAPTDNVKSGSQEYEKIKSKLNEIFKVQPTLKIPERTNYIEDKSPSPNREKESTELLDEILQEYEVIPDDFGKTKEFKENLNNLLMRKQSQKTTKPEYVRKYEKNNENKTRSSITDELSHKNKMANTLRSIKSLNDINKLTNNNGVISVENDKENHKKLMLATFRSIKLRKTGLPLTDEERRESREEIGDTDKENAAR